MNERRNIQSKFKIFVIYFPLWLLIWYILGVLYLSIYKLPSVAIFNIQESIILEENKGYVVDGSILELILFLFLWLITIGFHFTFGWLIAGEFEGYEYNSNLPVLFLLYFITLIQNFFSLFLIGVISGLIVLILVKYEILKISHSREKQLT